MTPHRSVDLTGKRRLLVVGDIHGEYDKLEAAVMAASYNPEKDAMVLLGDLIDRGPASERHEEWIARADVMRILGNHEMMPGMLRSRIISVKTARKWGGAWFADKSEDDLATLSKGLTDAPIAMTVTTPAGRKVGLVHADCGPDWKEHVEALENPEDPGHRAARELSLWERRTFKDANAGRREECRVERIDHVFHGHSPVDEPLVSANRTWLDTGACYGGHVTIIDVDAWIDAIETGDDPQKGKAFFAA